MVHNEISEQVTSNSMTMPTTALMEKFKISNSMLIEVGLFAGISFLVGFLIRRFAAYLIALVLFCVGLVVLQEVGIVTISINVHQLFQILGLSVPKMFSNELLIPMFLEWAKENIIITIVSIIGFLFGLQVG